MKAEETLLKTALQALSQSKDTLKKISEINRALTQSLLDFNTAVTYETKLLEPISTNPDNIVYTKALEILDAFYFAIRKTTMELYHAALIWPSFAENGQVPNPGSVAQKKNIVQVYFTDRAMLVKTPMLWSRARRDIILNGHEYRKKEDSLFREELIGEIINHPDFQKFDLSLFKPYILHFLYVYSPHSIKRGSVTDNDNHETKYIQDAITMFFPGGDNPFSCSVFLSADISSLIPEGTYITITPAQDGIKSAEEIELFWTSKLDQMN